jgi:hypothetical protein
LICFAVGSIVILIVNAGKCSRYFFRQLSQVVFN